MEIDDSDTTVQESKPSVLVQQIKKRLQQPANAGQVDTGEYSDSKASDSKVGVGKARAGRAGAGKSIVGRASTSLTATATVSTQIEQPKLFVSGSTAHSLPSFPNLGPLVRLQTDVRLSTAGLRNFVNSDTNFYPFEVFVTFKPPKPSDFMWNFKHDFYLSIMYSQVNRFFFPFNRQNSQLFIIIDIDSTSEPLCLNIPSRTMLRNVSDALIDHEEMGVKLFDDCLMIAVSAYKDYAAFFRLSSKPKKCPESYKNFCYVPPVWTNKLE